MANFSYEIEIPGKGKFVVDSPSELSDQQAYQAALQNIPPDPTEGMSRIQKFGAGFGQAFANLGRGIRDVASEASQSKSILVPETLRQIHRFAPITEEQVAEAKQLDKPLLNTGYGLTGSITGNVAAAVPASLMPGANTVQGAGVVGGLLGFLQPTSGEDSRILNTGLGAATSMAAQGIANKAANWIGTKIANVRNSLAQQQATNAVRDATLAEAQKAGYAFPPTSVKPSVTNTVLEAVSGKIKTAQAAAFKNQEVTNNLAKQALGVPADMPLTKATLATVREEAGQAYKLVESLPSVNWDKPFEAGVKSLVPTSTGAVTNPAKAEIKDLSENLLKKAAWTGGELVDDIKLLREMGRANMNAASRAGGDTAKSTLGKAQLKASQLLEDLAERNLANNKAPSTAIQALRDARQLIAKTYTVEGALNEATGNVNASVIGNLFKRGKPLTAELATIGKTSAAFPKATQAADSIGSVNPLSAVDALSGAAIAVGTGQPAAALTPLARPGIRSVILSPAYQRLMVQPSSYQPSSLLAAADRVMWNPLVRSSAGPLGAAGLLGYASQ